jgi:hypothetical protein
MLQTNLEQKTKLCERVEELAEQQGATLLQARTEVAQIRQQWESIGVVPKNAARSLDRRFSATCSKFEKSLLRQERIMARAGMDGLRERAALCRRLEMLLTAGEEEDIDAVVTEVHQQWESLTGLKADLEAAVKRRYETACGAVRDASERQQLLQTLHENQAKKKLLCLRMEIATGSKTPAAFAQDRLEYQVSRLSESMVERSGIPTKDKARAEADSIEREWYAMGSLPIDQNQMLEQRFQDALATSLES